ncbi:MAG: site-2 protease family protein [Limisphaerales bacterium]
MEQQQIIDGLLMYLILVIAVTFHEFGHAWMSWKRGDDTARLLGRISLNPIVHMELLGTVVLPLLGIFLGMAGSGLAAFVIGWGKPVPVNSANLKNPGPDWVLVAMAGPAMNVLLAIFAMAMVKVGFMMDAGAFIQFFLFFAILNLRLCFFNLIPIPPLDGSHLLRYFIGMSEEKFLMLSQYGFFILIVVIQFPFVRGLLHTATFGSLHILGSVFAVPLR